VKTAKKKSFGSGISICGSVKTNQAAGKISEPVINVTKRILNCRQDIGHAGPGDL
jgi:vacuolar-type H+-ATPase catalytic subunit A/Vma1